MSEPYADSYRDFLSYAKGHEMTVLHDDGLYRHLRFKTPGNSCGWFDLVTWPGNLSITGDFESYTFARIPDMFEFFASGVSGVEPGRINPSYWAEKLVAKSVVQEYSPEKFKQHVVEDFWATRENYEGESAELFRAIRAEVLDCSEYSHTARAALDSFRYYANPNNGNVFEFIDWWEWDINDWSIHYLRACHAIVWGINQYRAAVAEKTVMAA